MNWEAIGAVAELLGAIGVIVTLVYLAYQIRQNTQSNHMSALQMTSEQDTAFWSSISGDEQLADILIRGNRELRSLSEVENARYAAVMMQLYRFWDYQLELFRGGIMPAVMWESTLASMTASLSTSGVRSWWKNANHQFSAPLREMVDELLRDRVPAPGNVVQGGGR